MTLRFPAEIPSRLRKAPTTLWRHKITGALLMPSIAMVGVALPLGFVNQVDGYLKYLQPTELPPVYAWGWMIFGLIGLVIALATIVPLIGVARLLRQSPSDWAKRVSAWLALSIIAFSLLRGTKLWLQANGFSLAAWMVRFQWELAFVIIVGCAVWIWRRRDLPAGLHNLAMLVAVAGLVPVAIAVLTALVGPARAPTVPVALEAPRPGIKRPNIVLLTVDALSADHTSLYGYERTTTPNLEKLAQQASMFERFYANGNMTTSSVHSMMHGLRPWSHRAIQNTAEIDAGIAEGNLVARLKKHGYQTSAVATNDYAAPSHIRVAQWLDRVAEGRTKTLYPIPIHIALPPDAIRALQMGVLHGFLDALELVLVRLGAYSGADHYDPEIAFSVARDFVIHREPDRPFFLWVHLFPPHDPYATPPPFIGHFDPRPQARTRHDSSPPTRFEARAARNFPDRIVGRYDESILYVDHHLGRFTDWLKGEGLFDDALLIVSADHGESFVKGYGKHGGPMLHDALIHVPLIVKEPRQRLGRRLDVLAEQIDLMPTLLDLAGISVNGAGEGRSLKPTIRGEKMAGPIFSMNFEQSDRRGELRTGSVAMIEGRWKYVHYRGEHKYPMLPKLEDSLYDLQADPREETNVIQAQPGIAVQMLAEIQEQLRQHGRPIK